MAKLIVTTVRQVSPKEDGTPRWRVEAELRLYHGTEPIEMTDMVDAGNIETAVFAFYAQRKADFESIVSDLAKIVDR